MRIWEPGSSGYIRPTVTPRLEYVAGVIFSTVLGIDYEITEDRRKIGNNPSIFYSDEKVKDQFVIRPSGMLSAAGVTALVPEVTSVGDMPLLFASDEGSFPFDIFSAAFYMLSRYEEYLPFTNDAHGRFPGSQSLAYRKGFLQMPVVDIWARYLAGALVKRFPVITIRHNDFSSSAHRRCRSAVCLQEQGLPPQHGRSRERHNRVQALNRLTVSGR